MQSLIQFKIKIFHIRFKHKTCVKYLNCKLYYKQLHLTYLWNLMFYLTVHHSIDVLQVTNLMHTSFIL